MEKLNDYSGQFIPNLKPSDFSAGTLSELLGVYGRLYTAVDGFWYFAVKERIDNKEALACDLWVWERLCKYEVKRIATQLNIQGDDVVALMKALQMTPWFQDMECEIEIKNQNYAVYTVTRCRTLEALEKEGEGRELQICRTVEPCILKSYASYFNPRIKVTCLKVPPRKNPDGICCQWKFDLEK